MGKQKKRDHLEDPVVGGRIILKVNLKKLFLEGMD